jgi:ATP-dependent DNA helicase RecG (EC 3.6.1.-)
MSELSKVPVTVLKGVGEAMAEKLAKVGLENLQDVLFHLPLRYQDRTRVVPIGQLRPGQDAVIEGVVSGADVTMGKRRSLVVRLGDGSGVLSLRFYHFSNAQKEGLKRGTHLRCYGEARPGASGLEIYHPEYRALNGDEPPPPVEQTLTPIYRPPKALPSNACACCASRAWACSARAACRTGCPTNWPGTTSWRRWTMPSATCTTRRPTPTSTSLPKASTGPSTAWPSKNC